MTLGGHSKLWPRREGIATQQHPNRSKYSTEKKKKQEKKPPGLSFYCYSAAILVFELGVTPVLTSGCVPDEQMTGMSNISDY